MTGSSQVRRLVARDGIEIAYSESGSGSPLVVFVHATGFCKELCDPVVEETRRHGVRFRAIAIDQRAHGDSGVPEPPYDWWDVGGDLVELIGDVRPVIGVGHSAGGAVLVLAELLQPGLFASLILVEPIVFPPPYGRFPDNPMSAGARRRRRDFASREAAFKNFMAKPAFAGWEERAMRAYVSGGLRDVAGGVELKCAPEAEAEVFTAATMHRAWDRLGEVETPTRIIAGEHSTTHREPFLSELVGRFGQATAEVVPETSHFVWMEQPATVAKSVAAAVGELA